MGNEHQEHGHGRGGISPADMSHAMLLAVLMDNGGSLELSADAFNTEVLGTPDGAWHAVGLAELPDGRLRLSVQPRPADAGPGAGMWTQ